MDNEGLVLSALERIEKRLDKQEEKMDSFIETINAMKVNAAGCNAHFEELDRQVETVSGRGEKNIDRANDFFTLAKNIAWVVGIIAVAVAALVKLGVIE